MKKADAEEERAQRFLAKRAGNKTKGWDYSDAPEPRQEAKVTLPMKSIVWALELGLISNQPTLREVETLNERLGSWGRTLVPESISDTTLDTELRRLPADYLSAGRLPVGQAGAASARPVPQQDAPAGGLAVRRGDAGRQEPGDAGP